MWFSGDKILIEMQQMDRFYSMVNRKFHPHWFEVSKYINCHVACVVGICIRNIRRR